MNQLYKIAKELFDFIIITVLALFSLALVLPFGMVFTGNVGYFTKAPAERTIGHIFTIIKENFSILLKFSITETVLLLLPILNIVFTPLPNGVIASIGLAVSWIGLTLGGLLLIAAPMIVIKMKVSYKQLLWNSLILLSAGTWKSLLLIGFGAVVLFIGLQYPYALAPCLYFLALADFLIVDAIISKLRKKGEKVYEKSL